VNLDQCIKANRPLVFVTAETDVDVLRHIHTTYPAGEYYVYSTTLCDVVQLKILMEPGKVNRQTEAKSTLEALDMILNHGAKIKNRFTTYILLNCESYIGDAQNIRKVQDILLKYQTDEDYTVNLIMVSQKVCVPPQLERLSEMVHFEMPNDKQLKELSDKLTAKLKLTGDSMPSEEVVNNLRGLTLFEVEQAYIQSYALYKRIDLAFIRDFKKGIIGKTDLVTLWETNLTFADIGGMERLKKWFKRSGGGWTVEGRRFGLPLLKGVLLVGLSGCGKSLIAKALGNEWMLPVVDFDPGRVFSSRVGDSETNMRRVLTIVESMAPCILIVDEIEKGLAGLQSSSYSDSGVTARVIRSFLIWMQESTKPVFVVATANNIMQMPAELISRFNQCFFVSLPGRAERKDIFRIHLTKLRGTVTESDKDGNSITKTIDISDRFDLDSLAIESKDLSGREIEQILSDSMYEAFSSGVDISTEIILRNMRAKPSLIQTMAEQMNAVMKWVGFDPEKKDGLRARYASEPEPEEISRISNEVEALIKDVERSGNVGYGSSGPDTGGPCV